MTILLKKKCIAAIESIKEYIEMNNLDANVTIVGSLCENKCDEGPRIYVDGVEYKKVTQEKIAEIFEQLNRYLLWKRLIRFIR